MYIKREREAHRLLQQIDTFQLHLFTAQLTLVKKQQAEADSKREKNEETFVDKLLGYREEHFMASMNSC